MSSLGTGLMSHIRFRIRTPGLLEVRGHSLQVQRQEARMRDTAIFHLTTPLLRYKLPPDV